VSADPAIFNTDPREWVPLPVFRTGERTFSVDDILAATAWRGDLTAFNTTLAQRLVSAQAAEAAGLEPEPAAVEKALEDFRYARDLVSAEECERWLALRGLTFADLTTSVTCRLQAELVEEETPEEAPPPAAALLRTEALLADEFTDWARQLAWRVALARSGNALPPGGTASETVWAELEDRFAAACARLTEPARRQRELGTQRLPLLQTEIAMAEFGAESAAREACLCVREDGDTLTAVAETHGFISRTMTAFLGELPEDWQRGLLGASPGDVLPPWVGPSGALVVQLLHRREPSLDEAAVTERLDAALRRQHFGELETRHIRWLLNVDLET